MANLYLIIILLFSFVINVSYGQIRNDYSTKLKSAYDKLLLNKSIKDEELLFLIPSTQVEFKEYYSYTYPDKGKKVHEIFYQIDNLIGKRATENKPGFLLRYLELSVFVDGEYAESYYEDTDFIIEKNKNAFCNGFLKLSEKAKAQFKDKKKEYCK